LSDYVNLWAYGNREQNAIGLFERDTRSGKLKFVERLKWPAALHDMTLDTENGYVYFVDIYGKLFVFKL
jgi:hypothetical protein